jgi:hypothetical protein
MNVVMAYGYSILFNRTVDQCRATGARGGRISARNRRLRQAAQKAAAPGAEVHIETTSEASAALDRQFPWLAGAFRSTPRARS